MNQMYGNGVLSKQKEVRFVPSLFSDKKSNSFYSKYGK